MKAHIETDKEYLNRKRIIDENKVKRLQAKLDKIEDIVSNLVELEWDRMSSSGQDALETIQTDILRIHTRGGV